MTQSKKSHRDSLETLQRLRDLELNEARIDHGAKERELQNHHTQVAAVRAEIARTDDWVQGQISREQGLSVAQLRAVRDYATWQGTALADRQRALRDAQAVAHEAREHMKQRFQQLSVVERLRERRARIAFEQRQQREQKLLDEQALLTRRPGI